MLVEPDILKRFVASQERALTCDSTFNVMAEKKIIVTSICWRSLSLRRFVPVGIGAFVIHSRSLSIIICRSQAFR